MSVDIPDNMSQEDRKMAGLPYASRVEQIASKGEAEINSLESFSKSAIDWSRLLDHLSIHMDGQIAGSQFNGEVFATPREVVEAISGALPDTIPFDQHRQAEITVDMAKEHGPLLVGWTGVKSLAEIKQIFPEANVTKTIRMPGGVEDTVDGLEGAWYPERRFNPETKQSDIVMDENGQPANPRAKFEPKANVVTVPAEKFREIAATHKITVIILKDREKDTPFAVTAYPGENAPAFPARIDTQSGFQLDTLGDDSYETRYWQDHAFIKSEQISES